MENRKILRGTTGKNWTNTWRVGLFSPEEWVEVQSLGRLRAVPCCLRGHRTSHIATKGQKLVILPLQASIWNRSDRSKTNSTIPNNPSWLQRPLLQEEEQRGRRQCRAAAVNHVVKSWLPEGPESHYLQIHVYGCIRKLKTFCFPLTEWGWLTSYLLSINGSRDLPKQNKS